MHKIVRLIPMILLGMLLSGCASTSTTRNAGENFAFTQPPEKGLVVFSLLTTGTGYQANPMLLYRSVTDKDGRIHSIILENILRLPGSVGQQPYYGELKVIALPAGTYQYVGFELYRGINTGVLNRTPFAYQFKVAPGQVTYLGRIHFRVHYVFFKMPKVRMTIANYKAQDLKILKNYLPHIPRRSVQIQIMKKITGYTGKVRWNPHNSWHTNDAGM